MVNLSKKWIFLALSIFVGTQTHLLQNFVSGNVGISIFGHSFGHYVSTLLTMIMGVFSLKSLGKGIFK